MPERYLVTRRCVEDADVYEALPNDALESISEVHQDIGLGSVGTYGIDLDNDLIAEFAGASNLISMVRLGQYGLGYAREYQPPLENLGYEHIGPIVQGVPLPDEMAQGTDVPIEELPVWRSTAQNRAAVFNQRYYKLPKGGALNQGREGACTGFSVEHLLGSGPYMRAASASHARKLYYRARQLDEWEGESYEGSSISAACDAAAEEGLVARWGYAKNHDECVKWMLSDGGGVIYGMDWHEGMYVPNAEGYLRPTGRLTGGHAIYGRGVNRWRDVRFLNSWGAGWGYKGLAWMSAADMEYMWRRGKIEAICAVESPLVKAA